MVLRSSKGAVVSAGQLWWMVKTEADRRGAHHVRLVPLASSIEVLFDVGGEMDAPALSSGTLSALAMRLRRVKQKSGWHVETYSAGFGTAIHILRLRSESRPTHPADWTGLIRFLRESDEGLIVLIGPDQYLLRHALSKLPGITSADSWKKQNGAGLFDADEVEGRELAMHAVLRGLPAVAVSSRDNGTWWEALGDEVPVRIFKGHQTRDGYALEAYHCRTCR
jgi:hypothetical protein